MRQEITYSSTTLTADHRLEYEEKTIPFAEAMEILADLTPEEMAEALGDWINRHSSSANAKPFAESLLEQHRTLQALLIRFMVQSLLEVGTLTSGQVRFCTDDRNRRAVNLCQRLKVLATTGELKTHIPMI